jgi:hypothetical protein
MADVFDTPEYQLTMLPTFDELTEFIEFVELLKYIKLWPQFPLPGLPPSANRLSVVGGSGGRRRCIEGVHIRLAVGDNSDMHSPGIGCALAQPEEDRSIGAKVF